MTPEALRARAEKREQRKREMPEARLDKIWRDQGVILNLESGRDAITVSIRGEKHWEKDDNYPDEWRQMSLPLDDRLALAGSSDEFVRDALEVMHEQEAAAK